MVKKYDKYKWRDFQPYRDFVNKVCKDASIVTDRQDKQTWGNMYWRAYHILHEIGYYLEDYGRKNIADVVGWGGKAYELHRALEKEVVSNWHSRLWIKTDTGHTVNEDYVKKLISEHKHYLRPAGSWLNVL